MTLDNYEDKDPDCGSALTRLKKYLWRTLGHWRQMIMISCELSLGWCDRLSLKSFTDTDVCPTENPGHKWSTRSTDTTTGTQMQSSVT